jgi:hypothetical protein
MIQKNIEETLEVTVSAGVAMYKKGSSVEDLLKAAAEALYKAKENGRNRGDAPETNCCQIPSPSKFTGSLRRLTLHRHYKKLQTGLG